MKDKIVLSKYLEKVFESQSSDSSEWFGYYNYDALDLRQSRLICNRAKFDGVKPTKELNIELGYYDIQTGEWYYVDTTNSWNWQQGAMMQWLPGDGYEDKVIYNCTRNNHNCSTIYDLKTGQKKDLDWSIYGITPDGMKSIALEMERSHWCRAYHYDSVANPVWEGRVIDTDGIFEVDLENNRRKRIISIKDIINCDKRPYFDIYKHWVEHIMISPTGKRFCFLHRFSPMDNVLNYETRLCVADIDGGNLQVIPDWELYSWSHFGWKSDDEFAIYTQTPYRYSFNGSLGFLLKHKPWKLKNIATSLFYGITGRIPFQASKFFHGKRHHYQYYRLNDKGQFSLCNCYEDKNLGIDGHPSFTHDGRYMITDSYPDKHQMQRLIVFDTVTKKSVIIARFYANYYRNPASCDLHPKLSQNNDYLVVDSAFDTRHHIIVFKLNWNEIKDKLSK